MGQERDESSPVWAADTLASVTPPRGAPAEPAPPPPSPSSRYAAGETLGQGGMGIVRLFHDRHIGRDVALKMLHEPLTDDPGAVGRFADEARLQGRLEHPAIVPVYDVSLDDPPVFFTMKRVDGDTLADLLETRRRDPEGEGHTLYTLLTHFKTVCLAVDYVHGSGVVHRDLKPDNVMLGRFGEVYVLDWGCAIAGAALGDRDDGDPAVDDEAPEVDGEAPDADGEAPDVVIGTPGYAAPEQLLGRPLGPAADVFGLGAILYEILTGAPVFGQTSPLQRCVATVDGDRHRPSERHPELVIPRVLDELTERALHPEPDARPTARELAQTVDRFLADEVRSIHARRSADDLAREAEAAMVRALDTRDHDARAEALQRGARALALDPDNPRGREVLGRLLDLPPEVAPPDAQERVDAADRALARGATQALLVRVGIWLVFTPFVLALGPRNWPMAMFLVGLVVALAGATLLVRRARAESRSARLGLLLLNTTPVGGLAGLFGPFVLVPAFAATSAMLFALRFDSRDGRLAIALSIGAILVPFALELLGWIDPSMRFEDGHLVLLPRVVHFPPVLTTALLVLGNATVVPVTALLAVRLRTHVDQTRDRLALRAWQLERLLPDAEMGRSWQGDEDP
jgi:tRNA A-37 threonylcarbamoyl transferase component Bud32